MDRDDPSKAVGGRRTKTLARRLRSARTRSVFGAPVLWRFFNDVNKPAKLSQPRHARRDGAPTGMGFLARIWSPNALSNPKVSPKPRCMLPPRIQNSKNIRWYLRIEHLMLKW